MKKILIVAVSVTALFGCSSKSVEEKAVEAIQEVRPTATTMNEIFKLPFTDDVIFPPAEKDDWELIEAFCNLDRNMDRDEVRETMMERPSREEDHYDVWETGLARLEVSYEENHESVDFLIAEEIAKYIDFPCDWNR